MGMKSRSVHMKSVVNSPAEQNGHASIHRQAGRRDGVSFEDVKAAAERLKTADLPVSLRTVRAEIGTGSLSTVHKHLSALRAMEQPNPSDGPSPLSQQVLRALATEFERVAAERTSRIELELRDAQASVELLAQENDALRIDATETAAALESLRESHAESAGTVDALRDQLATLSNQLSVTQSGAEAVNLGLAVCQEQRLAAERQAAQLEAELRASRQELAELRRELAESKQVSEECRRTVAALQSDLHSKRQVEEDLKAAVARSQQHLLQYDEAKLRLAVFEVERSTQAERFAELKTALARAEENAQRMMERFFSSTSGTEDIVSGRKSSKT